MLYAKMQLIGKLAVQALKKALNIGSPSKVMRDQVGRWIPAGIAEGISDYSGVVSEALDDLAELYLQDYQDKAMAYGKGKRDEVIRKILGEDNFVPYDRLYGGTYLDELGRIRALEQKEEK